MIVASRGAVINGGRGYYLAARAVAGPQSVFIPAQLTPSRHIMQSRFRGKKLYVGAPSRDPHLKKCPALLP